MWDRVGLLLYRFGTYPRCEPPAAELARPVPRITTRHARSKDRAQARGITQNLGVVKQARVIENPTNVALR